MPVHSVNILITGVKQGSKYNDCAISEIMILAKNAKLPLVIEQMYQNVLMVRDRDQKMLSTLNNVSFERLSDKAIYWDADKGWVYTDKKDVPDGIKTRRDRIKKNDGSPVDEWLKCIDEFVIGQFSTIVKLNGGYSLIGKKAVTVGDGEWIELYPAVTFDIKGTFKSFTEFTSIDGAPGCHDVIPSTR